MEKACPKCGSTEIEFRYTEPTYGDWWKCKKCEAEFPGDQEAYDKFMKEFGKGIQQPTSLYVHRCHKCGKLITPEPTSLAVLDEIVILCSDCGKGVPISQGRKVKIIEQSGHDKISDFEQRINNYLEDGWKLVAATNDPHLIFSKIVYLVKEEKHD